MMMMMMIILNTIVFQARPHNTLNAIEAHFCQTLCITPTDYYYYCCFCCYCCCITTAANNYENVLGLILLKPQWN